MCVLLFSAPCALLQQKPTILRLNTQAQAHAIQCEYTDTISPHEPLLFSSTYLFQHPAVVCVFFSSCGESWRQDTLHAFLSLFSTCHYPLAGQEVKR